MKPISGLAKGFGALSMGLLGVSGPVLAVIAGLILLAVGLKKLYSASPEFKKFVDNIVDKLKAMGKWFSDILSKYVVPFFDGLFKWVNDTLPKVGAKFKEIFSAIWDAVKPAFTKIGEIASFVFPLIWAGIKLMWSIAKPIFKALAIAVVWAFQKIKAAWEEKLKPAIDRIKEAFQSVHEKVKDVVKRMIDRWNNFKRNMGLLRDALKTVINKIKDNFQTIRDKVDTVVEGVKTKFTSFKTALTGLWEKVKTIVGNIKSKFGEIVGSVKGAFEGLAKKVASPLNSFIRFLNKHLIGNINKVTGKFGLKIGDIPEVKGYASGGYTGNISPRAVAGVVHGDEHVIKSSSRRAIERSMPGALDYMNRTGRVPFGTGGIDVWPGSFSNQVNSVKNATGKLANMTSDLAGKTVGTVKDVGEKIAKHGVGFVLEKLVKGAKGLMKGAGIKSGSFVNDWFHAIMDKLAAAAKDWGGKEGEQQNGKVPTKVGRWTHPLYEGAPVTQKPNMGHRPTWSVDFGVPTGTRVKAASAGVVSSVIDKGAASYGKYIVLAHANGIKTLYAHLSSFAVAVGKQVSSGSTIGYSGSTGNSTGPHLHFELTPSSDTIAELRKRGVKLAQGGVARATPGGVLSVIAEAGHNERVEPLDSEGMSKRDRAMLGMIQAAMESRGNVGGDNFHVYPAPGMDEAALAAMVSRRVAWRRSVGT